MLRALFWQLFAWIVSSRPVARWLIARAMRTPYSHIHGRQGGGQLYMARFWLFNPYEGGTGLRRWGDRLPSLRIHWIRRPDDDDHPHDHPWNARTVILDGWYIEEKGLVPTSWDITGKWRRRRGYTGTLKFGEYHRIDRVCPQGVYTLFITWKKQGSWGFLVDDVKVPWRDYIDGVRSGSMS